MNDMDFRNTLIKAVELDRAPMAQASLFLTD